MGQEIDYRSNVLEPVIIVKTSKRESLTRGKFWKQWFAVWRVCDSKVLPNMSRCPLLTSAGAGSVESTYTVLRRASSGSSFRFTASSTAAGNTNTVSR